MSDELRVYPRHIRECGYCLVPGVRVWCELHGIDWKTLLRDGIPVSELEKFDDHFVKSVITKAREEQNGN